MVLSRLQDKPIGTYFLLLNGIIIVLAGFLYEPENALYTMLALYVTTVVIERTPYPSRKSDRNDCYTKSRRITASDSSKNGTWHNDSSRKGAYSKEDKHMLYLVITRYELYDLEKIINEIDPNAFTNIVQTAGVYGFFRREGDQVK